MDIKTFIEDLVEMSGLIAGNVFVTFENAKGSKMGPVHSSKIKQKVIENEKVSSITIIPGEITEKEEADG